MTTKYMPAHPDGGPPIIVNPVRPILLTVTQAAETLGLSKNTVRNLIVRGCLTPVRPTKQTLRLRRAEVERWVADGCPMPGVNQKKKPPGRRGIVKPAVPTGDEGAESCEA